jgi:glycosyltransferase involved in cell wall biosynthesis
VFHEFVPVGAIDRPPREENPELYALLVGAPWYLKGADVLIEAFLSLSDEFPEFKLRILGYFPDIEQLRSLAHGSTQIEFLKARPNPEAIEIIRRATVVVLPSRCEGMGRVLIEGMAAGIPLIGSNIGGIPFMIRDQDNGFIVPVGNAPALADRLRRLFTDNDMRHRMGARGYARAHEELNETVYVREFVRMVEATMQRSG